ncbi:MAG: TetR/AcrR family transcriptional regulator C-terminal domain-containing protein [Jatrophihabitans sp.]|uniref:TetR/AcrR family transcriptional regulator C-terminal domain-containing protein n=1 Tax=Jatrophihabitans sp. TaxID=1932789 RepID=UPI003F810EE9
MMAKNSSRPELSRDAIVERALEIGDAETLDAVTIRRLGQEFGVTPMALYWHVKNKDELLDAMGDALFAALVVEASDDEAWDVQLRAIVQGLVQALRRHPGSRELAYRRIMQCAVGLQLTERTLRLLRRAGFAPRQAADIAMHALQLAVMLVQSEPGAEAGWTEDDAATRIAEKRAAVEQLPADDFPYLRELAQYMFDCDDPDAFYDFNIDLFIAGARSTLTAGETAESPA